MMHRHAGFSLVEALMACALLGLVLVPALGAFRVHLAAADRMQARLHIERTLAERLNQSELRILAGQPGTRPSGFQADGLRIAEQPLESNPCGTNRLWCMTIAVTNAQARIGLAETRFLLHVPKALAPEAQP
jgi:hypothetical protein